MLKPCYFGCWNLSGLCNLNTFALSSVWCVGNPEYARQLWGSPLCCLNSLWPPGGSQVAPILCVLWTLSRTSLWNRFVSSFQIESVLMLGMLMTSGWVGSVVMWSSHFHARVEPSCSVPHTPSSRFHHHLKSITPVCSLLRATHASWAQSDISVTTQHTDAALNFVSPQNQLCAESPRCTMSRPSQKQQGLLFSGCFLMCRKLPHLISSKESFVSTLNRIDYLQVLLLLMDQSSY